MPSEEEIQKKMEAGLTREQAIEVIGHQGYAKTAEPARPEKPEAATRTAKPAGSAGKKPGKTRRAEK